MKISRSGVHLRPSFNILVCFFLISLACCFISCSQKSTSLHTVRFVARVHQPAVGLPIYLAGNDSSLGNWNTEAVLMDRESDSLWSKTLQFRDDAALEFKITAGSWWTQALAANEDIFDNIQLTVVKDTTVTVDVYDWLNRMRQGRVVLDAARFRPARPTMTLDGLWRYHPGDDTAWARPSFDDSGWPEADPFIQWKDSSALKWEGRGWFRFHMEVDSSLWNRTLAIRIEETGASRVFYNGRLLYSFGDIGAAGGPYKANNMSWWQEIRIDPCRDQVIAVQYANPEWRTLRRIGYFPGFLIYLKDINTAFRSAVSNRENAERQVAFTLIPLILALVHLALYGFLRSQRQNLYYALSMLGFAGLTYFSYERNLVVDVPRIVLLTKLGSISVVTAIFFGCLTALALNYERLPKRTIAYAVAAAGIVVLSLLGFPAGLLTALNYAFFIVTAVEGIASVFSKRARRLQGSWLLVAGFLLLNTFIAIQILVDYAIIPQTTATSQVYVYGMLSLALSMSLFLSYNFARVNNDLVVQLDTVKTLSAKALEQERLAHALALERTVIESESERKSRELESARALQLSLLPKELPRMAGVELAAMMKTATEVGGDYYDFFEMDDGTLTIAVGDATGHGLKAGNLVTVTKGLLTMLAERDDVDDIIVSANRAIKRMNLPMLTMCLVLARIRGSTLWYSSAGMPPLLLYRAASGSCEQLVLKAMPLGAVSSFPYEMRSLTVSAGDVIVMTSDGLFEIFNELRETYGMGNVMQSLQRHAHKSAKEIVQGLFEDGASWGGENELVDDLTIVVLKLTDVPPAPAAQGTV